MSIENLKHKLDYQAYDKLREVVKRNTKLSSLDSKNIDNVKDALKILTSWLEEVYQIDQKPISVS